MESILVGDADTDSSLYQEWQARLEAKGQKAVVVQQGLDFLVDDGVQMSAMASKDINLLEGHYDSGAVDPAVDSNVPGAKIYAEYCQKLGLENKWSIVAVQAAIMEVLTLRAVERAAVVDGQVTVRKMMNLSSSFDHRFVDGYDAAAMIQQIRDMLEHPATIFIA